MEGLPPSQGPEGTSALAAALDSYVKVQTGQSSDQAGATSERAALEAKVKEVATSAARSNTSPTCSSRPTRKPTPASAKAFGLPVNKALR